MQQQIVEDVREYGQYPKLFEMWIESRGNPNLRQFLLDRLSLLITHVNNTTKAEHLAYKAQQLEALLGDAGTVLDILRSDDFVMKEHLHRLQSLVALVEDAVEEKRERVRVEMERYVLVWYKLAVKCTCLTVRMSLCH